MARVPAGWAMTAVEPPPRAIGLRANGRAVAGCRRKPRGHADTGSVACFGLDNLGLSHC